MTHEFVSLNDKSYPVGSDQTERYVIDCEQAQMDAVKAFEFLLSRGAYGLVGDVLREYQIYLTRDAAE